MAIVEALLFADDSAIVQFDDASSLQLSSCGAVFRFSSSQHGIDNRHALYGKETQQFSQFATTSWKERVKLALDFRNKFANIPYVCRHFLGNIDVVEKKVVVNIFTWPGADKVNVIHNQDGSLTMKSLEDNAAVTLSACRQTFISKLLYQIPSEAKQDNPEKYLYIWVEQVYSINVSYPRHFYYPVNILLNGADSQKENNTSCIVTEMPRSLALNCKKAHMHRWRKHLVLDEIADNKFKEMESLKVLFSKGIFYRFYHQKYFIAEVIFPDGSFLRSEGPTQLYFKYWTYDFQTDKVKENTFTIKALPLDKKSQPHTISNVIKTSIRYLNALSSYGGEHRDFTCCWKITEDPLSIHTLPSLELESNIYVSGVGAFKTYSNGRIHIVFCDGAILDLIQPNQKQREDIEVEQGHKTMIGSQTTLFVNDDVFSLILPNGISYGGRLNQPGIYERYVHVAFEFIEWRRFQGNQTLDLDNEEESVVAAELDKLKRFNSLLISEPPTHSPESNSHLQNNVENNRQRIDCGSWQRSDAEKHRDSFAHWNASFVTTQLGMPNIQEHLQENRRTVDEIETVLEKCRRHLTKF